ncbi:Manganese/iron superoxide dismutase [Carpediemonas membranifera]|uniref:Superoxide dismutase n=1 Tax=Carpediemonas membranifera TaxID=201153 RepID=A0A8J6E078_9EUKA|nr:Manganese/iron superoxide dismutase [Carpediemonas membranifera]|eukprot:KAG9394689.1 Manganese/iron superoxide dismutase [Carpediemonas membranifera]
MVYEQAPLPYKSLEPHYDDRTLDVHYNKHHTAYCTKVNAALKEVGIDKDLEYVLGHLDEVPEAKRQFVANNGGGAWNHTFFWKCMAPESQRGEMSAPLKAAIDRDFGSFEKFIEEFSNAAATQFGSGWAWLVVDPATKKLSIMKTLNQATPINEGKFKPLLTIDVWEHAYYLNWTSDRPGWIKTFCHHLANWNFVSAEFAKYQ